MSKLTRKWLRHATMALILVIVAALVALAVQRVRRMSRPVSGVGAEHLEAGGDDPVRGIYTGFKYVETVAGQLVFALDSVRTLGKSSGWHEIEGVRLQLFTKGVEGPLLTAEAARFNVDTRDASLVGPVHVEFPDGAMLNTDTARFEAESRRLVAESRVLFTNGESIGQAGGASYSLDGNRLELSRGVTVKTADGMTLRAPLVVYLRDTSHIRFPDGCRIARDGSVIEAPIGLVELERNDGPPKRVEFEAGVTARIVEGPGGPITDMWTERLVADRDGSGNWQVEATTGGPWIELVMRGGDRFLERDVKTLLVRAVVGPDGILNLRAERGVCLREIGFEGDPHRAEADSARVWFEGGQPTDTELRRNVVLHAEGVVAQGHRARMSSAAGITMLHGDPTGPGRATLVSERGRISCDQVQMFDREGRIEARGDVQGELYQISLLGTDTDAGENTEPPPVHFASGVLDVTDRGGTFHLKDNSRLWQGQRLLLADEVIYRQSEGVVDASGHVRTTLPAREVDASAAADADVMVVARSLQFSRLENRASYVGNVRYSDPAHTLSANELVILFDDDNRVTGVEATGSVEMVDLASGRKMTGTRARRDIDGQTVHVTGSPVQLTDASGSMVSGSSLTWDQASGRVTMAGGTETIYYPEELP
jgi:lipopolysaccharide export system protein LptA